MQRNNAQLLMTLCFSRNFTEEQLKAFGVLDASGKRIIDPSRQLKTIEQGAATQVWCATSSRRMGSVVSIVKTSR
jgi:hypothetical protein